MSEKGKDNELSDCMVLSNFSKYKVLDKNDDL